MESEPTSPTTTNRRPSGSSARRGSASAASRARSGAKHVDPERPEVVVAAEEASLATPPHDAAEVTDAAEVKNAVKGGAVKDAAEVAASATAATQPQAPAKKPAPRPKTRRKPAAKKAPVRPASKQVEHVDADAGAVGTEVAGAVADAAFTDQVTASNPVTGGVVLGKVAAARAAAAAAKAEAAAAAEVDVAETDAAEVEVAARGAAEDDAAGAAEAGATKSGAAEGDTAEADAAELGAAESGAAATAAAETAATKTGGAKIGRRKSAATKTVAAKTDSAKDDGAKTDGAKTGAATTGDVEAKAAKSEAADVGPVTDPADVATAHAAVPVGTKDADTESDVDVEDAGTEASVDTGADVGTEDADTGADADAEGTDAQADKSAEDSVAATGKKAPAKVPTKTRTKRQSKAKASDADADTAGGVAAVGSADSASRAGIESSVATATATATATGAASAAATGAVADTDSEPAAADAVVVEADASAGNAAAAANAAAATIDSTTDIGAESASDAKTGPASAPAKPRFGFKRKPVRATAPESPAAEPADIDVALSVEGLTKYFGGAPAVDGIDLEVAPGTFFGIVGPNGAGKTTTLSMLTGLLRPDSGIVRVYGRDVWQNAQLAKRQIGVLPDRLRLFDRLTGAEFLYHAGALRGLDRATISQRAADLSAAFGLEHSLHRLVSDYSVGMTKKIAIAAAMIHAPRLLVLDEPFESVDPVSTAVVIGVLKRFTEAGGTVVLSSHSMELTERVCDAIAIIVDGAVLAAGPLAEVLGEQSLEDRFVELAGGESAVEDMEWLQNFSD